MTSAIEQIDSTTVKLTVSVDEEGLKPHLDHAYQHIAETVSIPGFRKGKVPSQLIEQKVGKGAVLEHAINEGLAEWYGAAVEEHNVKPVGQPEVDLTKVPGAEDGVDELEFTATVEVRPEVKLPKPSTLTVEVSPVEVSDEDVEGRLTSLRERFGTLVGVDRPAADGDFVVIDIAATVDGKDVDNVQGTSYQSGSGNMLEGLDEAVTGLSAGEETSYDGPLAAGDFAGQTAHITVKVTGVKTRELPEADDEFAQLASEFDTLDELKDDLRTQVGSVQLNNQAVEARVKFLEELKKVADFDLPKKVIENEVHQHLKGEDRLEDDEHRAEVTEEASNALRDQILLDQLADDLEIEIEEYELLDYLVSTSRQYGMDPQQFIEQVQQAGRIPAMVAEVSRSKATAFALRQVTVKDTAGTAIDLTPVIGDEASDAERKKAVEAQAGV